jgi:heptosyltransferase II
MNTVKKIIIRFPNWLGDIIMALPIVDALKERYPEASIDAVIKKPFDDLFKNDTRFTRIIGFDKPGTLIAKLIDSPLKNYLAGSYYDIGILCTRSISSALEFSLAHIKRKIGVERPLDFFLLTDTITFDKSKHQRVQYLSLLEPLGIQNVNRFSALDKAKHTLSSQLIDLSEPYIVLHPGASYGSAKTWPLDNYKQLAQLLIQQFPHKVIFCGDKTQHSPGIQSERITDLTGKTSILDLSVIIANADLVICNDSGPMHIADGLNVPLISLFGPTNPILTGPLGQDSHVIFNQTPCGPCFKRTCPIDHVCMKGITPEVIFEKAKHILNTHGPS